MKVFYQRTYSIAPYLTERIGFEVDTEIDSLMPDGKKIDPTTAVQSLKELCDKAHKELNPNLEEMKGTHVVPVQEEAATFYNQPTSKEQAIESHIQTINECKTINNLNIFKKLVEKTNHPGLTAAFQNKLKQLEND